MTKVANYRGRFAPSPTGALHAGSLVAALASWLDARAHHGVWLVRMEDVDVPRCSLSHAHEILRQLAVCGLVSDETVLYQSERSGVYQNALDALIKRGLAYPCACTRQEIERAVSLQGLPKQRNTEIVYPSTCRTGLQGKKARSWRFLSSFLMPNQPNTKEEYAQTAIKKEASVLTWHDRRLGAQEQNVEREVGDFVLRRADGLWAYQLAVVVDDAAQGMTHLVRGEDLASNTARQILLQKALRLPTPEYLHTPLVLAEDGQKLSKQNGAPTLSLRNKEQIMQALQAAATALGLQKISTKVLSEALLQWVIEWRSKYHLKP